MTVETTATTKTLKDLGWHLRAADPAKDKGDAGWVQENEAAGLKTRVYQTAPEAGLAARKIERARQDPSADLRMCKDCLFTYDTNDPNEAAEHAEHWHSLGRGKEVEVEESHPGQDPWAHEEEIKRRIVELLGTQGVEVDGVGTTPLGASYLAAGHELVVIGCGQHSQGLRGHILDAMRLRVAPIRTACVVACCTDDPAEYVSDEKVYDVQVLSVEQFEQRHAPALSDIIIQQLTACDTLPDFQRLVREYSLEKAMDYEPDARFEGGELDRLYDAIDAAAVRVGLRRREDESLTETEEGTTQNISGGEPEPATPAVPQSLLPVVESSAGASEAVAALRPQMHPRRIQRHPLTSMRAGQRDEKHIHDLEAVLENGGTFDDPVVVFYEAATDTYWLADGNYRHIAATNRNALLDVDVRQGTLRDAIEYAAGANESHGLKRSDNDKRLAVVTLLSDPEWFKLSDGLISKKARITPQFVGGAREYLGRLVSFIDMPLGQGLDAKEIAARAQVPPGLVQVVLDLPPETYATLTDNIANDSGERLGADGRTYNVKAAAVEKELEELPVSLPFDETVQQPTLEDESPADPSQNPEVDDSFMRLLDVLKAKGAKGATAEELAEMEIAPAEQLEELIQRGKVRQRIERHVNGRCFYRWQPSEVADLVASRGSVGFDDLEELGCQDYAIKAAKDDGLIKFDGSAMATVGPRYEGAAAAEVPVTFHIGERVVTREEYHAHMAASREQAAPHEEVVVNDRRRFAGDAETSADVRRDIEEGRITEPSPAAPQQPAAPAAPPAPDTRQQERPSVESLLNGRSLVITHTYTPFMPGKVNVGVRVCDNVARPPAVGEVVTVTLDSSKVRNLPEAVLEKIAEQVKADDQRKKSETQKPAPPAAKGRAAATKSSAKTPAKASSKKFPSKKAAASKKPAGGSSKKSSASKGSAKKGAGRSAGRKS